MLCRLLGTDGEATWRQDMSSSCDVDGPFVNGGTIAVKPRLHWCAQGPYCWRTCVNTFTPYLERRGAEVTPWPEIRKQGPLLEKVLLQARARMALEAVSLRAPPPCAGGNLVCTNLIQSYSRYLRGPDIRLLSSCVYSLLAYSLAWQVMRSIPMVLLWLTLITHCCQLKWTSQLTPQLRWTSQLTTQLMCSFRLIASRHSSYAANGAR